MKKRIVFGIIAALALLFVLPGCSDPSNAIPLEKIAGPANLKATAYEGMNLLTWNPVVDATGYEVWRKDPTSKLDSLIGSTGRTQTYYKDFIGLKNKLVDGQNYEYTVVATSAKSTSQSNQGIAVQNGTSKASVKAKIPTALTASTFAATDISAVAVASDPRNPANKDVVFVTVSNVQPNYEYSIAYTYGKDVINRSFNAYDDDDDDDDDGDVPFFKGTNEYVARFPVLGGDNTVNVTASFGGFSGGYYTDAATHSQVVTASYAPVFDLDTLGTTFTSDRTNDGVFLMFDDVVGADIYDIYKIETKNVVSNVGGNVSVIGDWIKVTAPKAWNNNEWIVKDETTTTGVGNFLYALIIGNTAGSKANKVLYSNEIAQIVDMPASLNIDTYGTDNKSVQITWTADLGVAYKLEYAEVKAVSANSNANWDDYTIVVDYKDMEIAAASYLQGVGVVRKTDLTPGKNYIFRLSGTQNGVTTKEADMVYGFLTSGAFTVQNGITLNGSVGSPTLNAYPVTLTLHSDDAATTYKVYKRAITTPQTAYTLIKEGEFNTLGNASVTDSADGGFTYTYKMVDGYGFEKTWSTSPLTLIP